MRARGSDRFQSQPEVADSDGAYPALGLDSLGRLLVPTSDGLARRTARGWETVTVEDGLGSSGISAVFRDREGNIWLGLVGSGLARWLGYNEWQSWTRPRRTEPFLGIVDGGREDASGTLWAGTQDGLDYAEVRDGRLDLEASSRFRESKRSERVISGPDGALWIGGDETGLIAVWIRAPAECSGFGDRGRTSWRRSTPHGGSRGQRVGFHHARLVPDRIRRKPRNRRAIRAGLAARFQLLRTFRDDGGRPQRWNMGRGRSRFGTVFRTANGSATPRRTASRTAPSRRWPRTRTGPSGSAIGTTFGITPPELRRRPRQRSSTSPPHNGLRSDKTIFLGVRSPGMAVGGHGPRRGRVRSRALAPLRAVRRSDLGRLQRQRLSRGRRRSGLDRHQPGSVAIRAAAVPPPSIPPQVVFTSVTLGGTPLDLDGDVRCSLEPPAAAGPVLGAHLCQ